MTDDIRFTLRVPRDLRDMIAAEADKQGRSMHNLIIWIIRDYFENKK